MKRLNNVSIRCYFRAYRKEVEKADHSDVIVPGSKAITTVLVSAFVAALPGANSRACTVGDILEHDKKYYSVDVVGFSEVDESELQKWDRQRAACKR